MTPSPTGAWRAPTDNPSPGYILRCPMSVAPGTRYLLGLATLELLERRAQTLTGTARHAAVVGEGDPDGGRGDTPGILSLSLVVPWALPTCSEGPVER